MLVLFDKPTVTSSNAAKFVDSDRPVWLMLATEVISSAICHLCEGGSHPRC